MERSESVDKAIAECLLAMKQWTARQCL